MGNTDASISYVARAVFTLTCVLSTCIYAAPTCLTPVIKTYQVGLCKPDASVEIWDCPNCPHGAGLSVECGHMYNLGTQIDCVPCKKGVNFSSKYDNGQCKQCTKCQENQEEIESCEVDRDRNCSCKTEYYRDNILQDCKPCSWCCGDDSDEHIPKCKAMPQGKHCAFKVNGKSCGPTTSIAIAITTVTTTAPSVETTTSQEPLGTKTKRQVHVNKTSYDSKNTTGSPDTVLSIHETSENMPFYIFYIVGAVSLIVILVLGAVICRMFLKNRSSTSTNNSAVNSRTTSSVELHSSVPLLLTEQPSPQKPFEDISANKIQISTNDGTAIYINKAGQVPLLHADGIQETVKQSMPATAAEDKKISTSGVENDSTICYTQDGTLQNCPENILNAEKKQSLEVTQLPSQVYAEVCQMLNAKEPFFRDYRVLAEKLGVSNNEDIEKLGENKSPTNALLLKHRVTTKTFIEILKSIDREDVVKVIEVWLNNN